MSLLDVTQLSKHYGGVAAVEQCAMSLEEDTITGLIGPNGAGKSTTLELISGFQTPDSGTVRFNGVDVTRMSPYRRARLGLVRTFQTARQWANLTVMESMLVAVEAPCREVMWRAIVARRRLAAVEKSQREQAREVLSDFALYDLRDHRSGALSGGQKRLVEFARIVMLQPRMALLDEPLAGVNPVLIPGIESGIRKLQTRGVAVLLIEHNLAFVERLCPTVIAMSQGRVVGTGSMQDLRRSRAVVASYLGTEVNRG